MFPLDEVFIFAVFSYCYNKVSKTSIEVQKILFIYEQDNQDCDYDCYSSYQCVLYSKNMPFGLLFIFNFYNLTNYFNFTKNYYNLLIKQLFFQIIKFKHKQYLKTMNYNYSLHLQGSQIDLPFLKKQLKIVSIKNYQNYILIVQTLEQQQSDLIYLAITEQQSSQECNSLKKYDQSISCQFDKRVNIERVCHCGKTDDIWYIILQNPFQLYYITNKSKHPIKIILSNEYSIKNIIAYFSSQAHPREQEQKVQIQDYVYVFGLNTQKNKNILIVVNLMTFDVKQIWNGTGYAPKSIVNAFQYFQQDRLYILGGNDVQGQPVEQLMWTYDFQKGYWFALQMKYNQVQSCFQNAVFGQYSSGKIVIFKDGKFNLLQIYQSQLLKLQILQETNKKALIQEKLKGIFRLDKRLFVYTEKTVLPLKIKLQVQKNKKNQIQ